MANFKDLIVNGDARIVGKLYANQSMPDGVFFLSNVSGTAAVTSSPYTSAKWYTTVNDSRITSLYSGLTIALKIPVEGHWTYGTLLNINGLGDHPVVFNVNSMIGNRYSAGSTIMLIYNATQTATGYSNSASATTYTGCWQMEDYDTTNVYQLRDGNANMTVSNANLYRYQLCFTGWHGTLIPYNEVNNAATTYTKAVSNSYEINPYGPIYFYNSTTTVNKGSNAAVSALFQHVNFDCRYSMNIQSDGTSGTTALVPYGPVYVKIKEFDWNIFADVSSSNYLTRSGITQSFPNEKESWVNGDFGGDILYVYLGRASSKYQIELDINHPIYKWSDGASQVRPYVETAYHAGSASYATNAAEAGSANSATSDGNGNNIINTYATKTELNTAIGNINSALDAINGEVI